jgi:hypothetical protein
MIRINQDLIFINNVIKYTAFCPKVLHAQSGSLAYIKRTVTSLLSKCGGEIPHGTKTNTVL